MYKKIRYFAILVMIITLAACSGRPDVSQDQQDKNADTLKVVESKAYELYGIKSGIITYKIVDLFGDQQMKITFDRYGAIKRTDMEISMFGQKIQNVSISDSTSAVSWDPKSMTGNRAKLDPTGPDWINFTALSDSIIKAYNIKEIGKEEVLGKPCVIYSLEFKEGDLSGKYSIWNGITLKMVAKAKGKETKMEAIKLEENVTLPADVFKIPDGIVFKDLESL